MRVWERERQTDRQKCGDAHTHACMCYVFCLYLHWEQRKLSMYFDFLLFWSTTWWSLVFTIPKSLEQHKQYREECVFMCVCVHITAHASEHYTVISFLLQQASIKQNQLWQISEAPGYSTEWTYQILPLQNMAKYFINYIKKVFS